MSHSSVLGVLIGVAEQNKLASDSFNRALSAVRVRSARNGSQPQKLADGGGLVLYIPPSGGKAWRYRYRLAGREQTLTIGAYPEVSLEQARVAHRAARWLVARGVHPLQHAEEEMNRANHEAQTRSENSFQAIADRWLDATDGNLSARTVRHRRAMLAKHVLPKLGDSPIDDIRRKDLHELLTAIDATSPVTARHCRAYIKQIFEFAEDSELVDANPTPRAGVLLNAANRRAAPRKALSLSRLGEFLLTLETAPDTDPLTKAAMRLVLLTWCRTSEVVGARWSEIDLEAGTWTIPAERMKGRQTHTVRLSAQAVAVLREVLPLSRGGFVFPNRRSANRAMSRMTLTNWRKRWGFAAEMDVHGFRAMTSTWANESGRYRPDVIEVALAHREADRVRAAYNRAEFAQEVRGLLQDWADVCDELVEAERARKQNASQS